LVTVNEPTALPESVAVAVAVVCGGAIVTTGADVYPEPPFVTTTTGTEPGARTAAAAAAVPPAGGAENVIVGTDV
jgi:hypothetical protein